MLREETPDEERIGTRDLAHWETRLGRWLAGTVQRYAARLGAVDAATWVLVVIAAVGLAVVAGITAVAEDVYESVVERNGLERIDQPVLDQAVAWRSPTLDTAVTAYTDLGGPIGMPVIAVIAVILMVVFWRSRTPVVLMVIAAVGSLAMTVVGKDLVGRARPPRSLAVPPFESSPSFPSGHTLNATVIVGVIVYLLLTRLHRAWARVAVLVVGIVVVLTMGLSRVFLGHHWLSDVVMGWLLGLAWLAVIITAHRLYLTVRRNRAVTQSEAAGRSATQ
jgi:undecaprenyl-diphosphatase